MTDLFTNFSISEIILCVLGIFIVIDWFIKFKNTIKTELNNNFEEKKRNNYITTEFKRRNEIQDSIKESVTTIKQSIDSVNSRIDKNTDKLNDVCETVKKIEPEINYLTQSNNVLIKAQISNKYKEAMQNGCISTYDLEICEKMYNYYLQNTNKAQPFIKKYMEELRTLPNEKI